ncbi:phage tail protein [Pseudoroseomonas rhizosphaerae]|uniref:Phage tail protein n=1 Tax=Teichococcus rhizosphaerae TaxID=1335062 RepID=A0A2C6ZYN0_9PROT|nr:phage tail protein [Pseudoroseomonas rhizosphaerae]PHK92918.1 phage tail protein [Pseudoroseomonas rhizosphaerae]
MPIVQAGSFNTTAIDVPDIYVQVQPPQALLLNGVASHIVGVVGTANWGPVNQPAIIAGMADYDRVFGGLVNRLHDAGTAVAVAIQQGAADFRVVRVTDGTDAAAAVEVDGLGSFTALYTGSHGNNIRVSVSAGSRKDTKRVVVNLTGNSPEVFDNLPSEAPAFAAALQMALMSGQDISRPASNLVRFTPAAEVTATIENATYALTGGTDGGDVDSFDLMGSSGASSGLYVLAGTKVSTAMVADLYDATTYVEQTAWGAANGCYMVMVGQPGETILDAVERKQTAGLDDHNAALLFGDWCYWRDPVNQVIRLVSPQGFLAGKYGNLLPNLSALNQPLVGIVATQRTGGLTGALKPYSTAELAVLFRAGIDVITNPAPRGSVWALRGGFNASTNASINGDNHPRMVNYIAKTLNEGLGLYVGRMITPDLLMEVRATQVSFLEGLVGQGMLVSMDGQRKPYLVICDRSNNPDDRLALNYLQSDAKVRINGIAKRFIANLEAGQTVVTVED